MVTIALRGRDTQAKAKDGSSIKADARPVPEQMWVVGFCALKNGLNG
ncbi:MAG TPA: hypothetical protein VFW04_09175 [Gemmatimonadaceae bacterium]|nr:hypothetical protein [Gemmatimonadaceae bacterium]